MAKRSSRRAAPKTSGGSSMLPILIAAGVGIAGVILLMPKSASASPGGPSTNKQPGPITNPGGPTITILATGSDPSKSPIPIPAFAVKTDVAPGDVGVYLQTFDASGKGVFPGDPVVADFSTNKADVLSGDLAKIVADGAFASYFTGTDPTTKTPYLTFAKNGKTLIWTSDDQGKIITWWLTQWS